MAICARSEKNLADAAERIRSDTGKDVFTWVADVSKPDAVREFVEAVEAEYGRVDICVTNAGGPPAKTFLDISAQEWREAIDQLLMGTIWFARETLPRMKKHHWGRLITITSISVKQPIDGLLLSNSVRAAVAGLARTLANEFGPFGITVNNVCPGYTLTERLDELAEATARSSGEERDAIYAKWTAGTPLGRVGKPEEFAAMVAFLASERASYINGTSIAVDGGMVRSLL